MDDAAEDWWNSESLEDLERQVVHESDESTDAYLRESWLSFIMAALRDTRRSAGLTQQALAQRLGTQQPAVSRLEHDEDTSLERFVDYLMACGRMPFEELETAPLSGLRKYLRANPNAPRTAAAFKAWQAAIQVGERIGTAMSSVGGELTPGLEAAGVGTASGLSQALQDAVSAAVEHSGLIAPDYQSLQGIGYDLSIAVQATIQPVETTLTNAAVGTTTALYSDLSGGMGKATLPAVESAIARAIFDVGRIPAHSAEGLRAFWRKASPGQGTEGARPVATTRRQMEVAA